MNKNLEKFVYLSCSFRDHFRRQLYDCDLFVTDFDGWNVACIIVICKKMALTKKVFKNILNVILSTPSYKQNKKEHTTDYSIKEGIVNYNSLLYCSPLGKPLHLQECTHPPKGKRKERAIREKERGEHQRCRRAL